jgi:hypothetical protein
MHDCKATNADLVEMALNDARLPGDVSIKLLECPTCREELNSLRNTMQMTRAAMNLAEPPERFWSGYEARLRERLVRDGQSTMLSSPARGSFAAVLRRLAMTSVPVPAPLALAMFGFVVFAAFFMLHSPKSSGAPAVASPAVVEKTVEVPVVHEKVITRVVYRSRNESAARLVAPDSAASRRNIAEKPREESICIAESLEGFKPAHDARLKIIKGSYRDDK